MTMFNDPIQLEDVQKYALGVTWTTRIAHLESEEYLAPTNGNQTWISDLKGILIGIIVLISPTHTSRKN